MPFRKKRTVAMKRRWSLRKTMAVAAVARIEADIEDVNLMHNYCSINKDIETECETRIEVEANSHQSISEDAATSSIIEEVSTTDPWDPKGEYNSIVDHVISVEEAIAEEPPLKGNRIVDINHILVSTLKIQHQHSQKCTFGLLQPVYEKKCGLSSIITLKCSFCGKIFEIGTEKATNTAKSAINTQFVWGTLTCGSTYNQVKDAFAVLDIPCMGYRRFRNIENELGDIWKDTLWECMSKAGQEELQIAVERGQISNDGTPWISVHCDGGWSKRSYGHSYSALSGTAVVIGKETGKVIFIGVRNKYCCICARAANNKTATLPHTCFKNWDSSSSSMEADVIVDAFKNSRSMHGVKYLKVIADGDSSVFARIKKDVEYGNEVEKIDCINHLVKNYGKVLYKIKNDTALPVIARKILTQEKVKKLQNFVMHASFRNDDPEVMKAELMNSVSNIFGDHVSCDAAYCNVVGRENNTIRSKLLESGLVFHLKVALEPVLNRVHKFIVHENNNKAETFMSVLAKYNCGKRLNLIQRRSFEVRSYLSALKYNDGLSWQPHAFEDYSGSDVGEVLLKRLNEYNRKKITRRRYKKRKHQGNASTNGDYGPHVQQTLLNEAEYRSEYKRILTSLQVTEMEQWQLSVNTVGQFSNPLFVEVRGKRLTASNFGAVIKRRSLNNCAPLLKNILYRKNLNTPAILFGKKNEEVAKRKFEEEMGLPICDCGLFVDLENGFLGASPDGLVGEDAIIEIKCAYSLNKAKQSIEDAVRSNKHFYLKKNDTGEIVLKENHNYFYQIQGQLNIVGRDICYFCVFVDEQQPLFVVSVKRNKDFWKQQMVPKLKKFYMGCMLPELIQRFSKRQIQCQHTPIE